MCEFAYPIKSPFNYPPTLLRLASRRKWSTLISAQFQDAVSQLITVSRFQIIADNNRNHRYCYCSAELLVLRRLVKLQNLRCRVRKMHCVPVSHAYCLVLNERCCDIEKKYCRRVRNLYLNYVCVAVIEDIQLGFFNQRNSF